ncbi:MAG TPA: hypothetical protein VHY37_02545 [Tepidisphaeraceae bacterium]|nr:hypothetical protein [Tepidisphaeraceae bacterium]
MPKQAKPAAAPDVSPFSWRSAAARLTAACAVYALAVGTVFGDLLFRTDKVLSLIGTDIWRQFYPWRVFGFGELAKGHLALWNPYIFSGAPFLGGFQSALLYPPNWICMVLPMPMPINLGIAMHIFLAGAFMYCWASYRRLRWPACVAAGLVYMFGGPEFGRIVAGHITHIDTLTWAPLVFLAIDDLTMTRSLRGAFLGSAAFAMQIFAGHAQYAFYTAVMATVYFLLNLFSAPSRWRAMAGYVLCFAGGGLIAAAQLFTGLGATSEAMRRHTTYQFASTFSFPPENLLTLIMPGFFGDTSIAHPYWGRWFWWEATAYVGVVGLVLACLALAAPRRNRRFAFTMAIVILVLAMGKYIDPTFWIVYRLPGFSSFRGIAKLLFLFVMFVALLAGIGLDRLLAEGCKRIWPAIAVGTTSVAMLLAGAYFNGLAQSNWTSLWGRVIKSIDWFQDRNSRPVINLDFLHGSATMAAGELFWAAGIGLVLAALLLAGRWNRRIFLGIPLLMAIELMMFASDYCPTFSVARYQDESQMSAESLAGLPPDARVLSFEQGQLMMAGGLNVWGDDPMMLRRYVEFMAKVAHVRPEEILTGKPTLPGRDARLPRLVRMAGTQVTNRDGVRVARLDAAPLPHAELVGAVQIETGHAAILAALNAPLFDPLHTALIESPIDPSPAGATDPGRVTVSDINSDTLDIEAWANSPCLLVVTDSYSSGWHAEALPDSDQHAYQVIPADLTLRGVPLSAGHHHFRMIYRPAAFVIGKWTSLAAIFAYLLAAAFSLWGRKRNPLGAGG